MLNALGTPYERRIRASAALKICKQRIGDSPTELLNYMRNLWEEIAPVPPETQAIDFVNALHPWIQKDLALQDAQKRLSLRDCEEMANISYRRQGPRKDPNYGRKRGRGNRPEKRNTSDANDSTKTYRGPPHNKRRRFTPKGDNSSQDNSWKSKVTCYNCNKLGHFSSECRSPKKDQNKDQGKESGQK